MAFQNVALTFYDRADSRPDALALAFPAAPGKPLPSDAPIPYREISFRQLADATRRTARALQQAGFQPGDRAVLMVPPQLEFFTLMYAMLQCGIIPVLIDPGIGFKNLKTCIHEAAPVGFIGISRAQLGRVLLGWGRKSIKKKLTVGPRLFWGGSRLDIDQTDDGPVESFRPDRDDLSHIAFTSGSTGLPKGVMFTHGNLWAQVEAIRKTFDFRPGDVDLPTFAPFALLNPVLGVSSVIPDMDPTKPAGVEPERILRAIDQFGVNSMFGSPTLLDRVARYGEAHGVSLPTLRRVLSAGAPVPARTQARFSKMLTANSPIYTPYGATEAMPVSSVTSRQLLHAETQARTKNGGGVCIGTPVEGVSVRIIRISDEPIRHWSEALTLPAGQVGEITVRGPNVTRAYFRRESATQLAKIKDGAGFWHRMGDLGYLDEAGQLWFCGRKGHRVPLTEGELYSVPCEMIFNTHPAVFRTGLVGVERRAVLCVELDPGLRDPDHRQIEKELLDIGSKHEMTRDIRTVLFHPSFPVDIRHNAKIFREKLAVWAKQEINKRPLPLVRPAKRTGK